MGTRPRVVSSELLDNATITACEKGEQWPRALELFEEMRSQGLPAGVVVYNATITACER